MKSMMGILHNCICCDECCFCDNMIKLCCCFCRRKITRNNSNNQDVETGNKQQIELPEICGNFKNDINQEEDSKNRYNRYGLFNINPDDIILDEKNDDD